MGTNIFLQMKIIEHKFLSTKTFSTKVFQIKLLIETTPIVCLPWEIFTLYDLKDSNLGPPDF